MPAGVGPIIPEGRTYEFVSRQNDGLDDREAATRFLRIGQIEAIDYERGLAYVNFVDGPGGGQEVEIGFGSFGLRSFVGAMLEEDQYVVVGWRKDSPGNPRPIIISALGGGWKAGRNYDPAQRSPFGGTSYETPKRRTLPKLYPGDALIRGARGGLVKATDNLLAQSADGQLFLLRAVDQHSIQRALNLTRATGAGREYQGPIIRNPRVPVSPFLDPQENGGITPHLYQDGRQVYYVTPLNVPGESRKTILEGGTPYIEDRQIIRELSDVVMDVFREADNREVDYWRRQDGHRNDRFMEIIRGTFVGDDDSPDGPESDLYGKILRVVMFGDSFSADGFSFDPENPDYSYEEAASEYAERAMAIADHYRYLGSTFRESPPVVRDMDKTGAIYEVIGASGPDHPLGDNISIARAVQGAIKEHIGASEGHGENNPLELDAIAAERTHEIESGISIFRTYDGALHMKVKAPDSRGDAWVLEVEKGNLKLLVRGDGEIHYTGDFQEFIDGDVERVVKGNVFERVEGSLKREVGGDEFEQIAGSRLVGVNGDDTLHIGGGQAVGTQQGRNEYIGTAVPVPSLPPAPPDIGAARDNDGNRDGQMPGTDPNPGVGSGLDAPGSKNSSTIFGGNMDRTYLQNLTELVTGQTDRTYTGQVSETFASPASRRYLTTLTEEVVGVFQARYGSMIIQALGAGQISAEASLLLRSSVSVIEQAPVVVRG